MGMRKMDTRSPDGSENGMRRDGLGGAKSITDLAKRVEKSWEGGLILKNSLFPTKLLLTEGEMEVVEQLMRDEQDKPYLKIKQWPSPYHRRGGGPESSSQESCELPKTEGGGWS